MSDPGMASVLRRPLARCPECGWREGPYDTVQDSHAALLEHVRTKHKGLCEVIFARMLPVHNEAFARSITLELIQQAGRLDRAMSPSLVTGPQGNQIDVAREMAVFIRTASKGIGMLLDILLTAHTGKPALVATPARHEPDKETRDETAG